MKKYFLLLLTILSIFLQSCTTQEKIGIEQFVTEMNNQFEISMKTSDFQLGYDEKGLKYLFNENENYLTTLALDQNNHITGISLLFLPDGDITYYMDYFAKMCSVFTHTPYEVQMKNLNNSGISTDKINFADGNTSATIGKYKYTIISNTYSVTLFCDKT